MVPQGDNANYPDYLDVSRLKPLEEQALTERARGFKSEHETFVNKENRIAKLYAPLRDHLARRGGNLEREYAEKIRELFHEERQPPPFEPLKGHNPARFSPFDFTYQELECAAAPICRLRGPDRTTGQVGADLGIVDFPGAASSVSSVGFAFVPQASGTLQVTVQARVWEDARLILAPFSSYSSCYAGLRVYVEELGSPVRVFQATRDVYDRSAALAHFELHWVDWHFVSVDLSFPVSRGTVYRIFADAVQRVFNGPGIQGVRSNYDFSVGPILFSVV